MNPFDISKKNIMFVFVEVDYCIEIQGFPFHKTRCKMIIHLYLQQYVGKLNVVFP